MRAIPTDKVADLLDDLRATLKDGVELLVDAPEVEEVVRCKDCKYSDTIYETTVDTMPLKCLNIRYGGVLPDWYCEHGERREE